MADLTALEESASATGHADTLSRLAQGLLLVAPLVALAILRLAHYGWADVAPDDARYLNVGLAVLALERETLGLEPAVPPALTDVRNRPRARRQGDRRRPAGRRTSCGGEPDPAGLLGGSSARLGAPRSDRCGHHLRRDPGNPAHLAAAAHTSDRPRPDGRGDRRGAGPAAADDRPMGRCRRPLRAVASDQGNGRTGGSPASRLARDSARAPLAPDGGYLRGRRSPRGGLVVDLRVVEGGCALPAQRDRGHRAPRRDRRAQNRSGNPAVRRRLCRGLAGDRQKHAARGRGAPPLRGCPRPGAARAVRHGQRPQHAQLRPSGTAVVRRRGGRGRGRDPHGHTTHPGGRRRPPDRASHPCCARRAPAACRRARPATGRTPGAFRPARTPQRVAGRARRPERPRRHDLPAG